MRSAIHKFFKDEKGATLVEYALMLMLIMVVCVAVVALLGTRTSALFTFSW